MITADRVTMEWTPGDVIATRYRNGFVAVPVLWALDQAKILGPLRSGTSATLGGLCPDSARAGGVLGALRTLALLRWATIEGTGQAAVITLTPPGRAVVAAFGQARDAAATAVQLLAHVSALPDCISGRSTCDELTGLLRRLAALCREGWGTDHVPLRACFDGLVLSPLIVAYSRASAAGTPAHEAGLELLLAAGLAERTPGGTELTAQARELVASAADFGVIVSYAQVLAGMPAALAGGHWQNSRSDDDLQRELNTWGSARNAIAVHLRRRLLDEVLVPLFDTEDLAAQPAGLIDVGCGSGRPLREMAELVLSRTRRGRHLQERPLLLAGADISPTACEQTRGELRDLADRPGVQVVVLGGDVADPAALDRDLRAATGDGSTPVGLADLLHSQMFLLHDRELSLPPGDADGALARLADLVAALPADLLDDSVLRLAAGPAGPDPAGHFTVDQAAHGRLVPAAVVAADLVSLMARWRPYLRHGLLMVEAHVPRLADLDTDAVAAGVDPAPSVWGVHTASGQYLMPYLEHELAMGLAGLVPAFSTVTGTGGISAAHWLDADVVYGAALPAEAPDFASAR